MTSRTFPAASNAGVSSKSSATLSPSCEETLHPVFGTSVMTRSSSAISQVPMEVRPVERKVLTNAVASVVAMAFEIS